MKEAYAIHWFRRDLRVAGNEILEDEPGYALAEGDIDDESVIDRILCGGEHDGGDVAGWDVLGVGIDSTQPCLELVGHAGEDGIEPGHGRMGVDGDIQ